MSLSFTSTNRVDVGSPSVLDDIASGAMLARVNMTSFNGASFQQIVSKVSTGVCSLAFNNTNGIRFIMQRDGVDLQVTAPTANFAALGTAKWIQIAVVWDINGVDGDQKMFIGDRQTAFAEPSSYTTQLVGDSAITANATGNCFLGNNSGGTQPLLGTIALVQIISGRVLTLGELKDWQYRPRWVANTVGLWMMGWNSTTNVPDLSGNANTGTITGATVAGHDPLGNWNDAAPGVLPYIAAAPPAISGFYYRLLLESH